MPFRPIAGAAAGALLGVAAVFLPAAAPAAAAEGDPLVVAHRGASGYAPENTLAAVDAARRLGVRWVENDVQRTRDGELVVMHDVTLERTTDAEEVFPGRAPWKVADFTAAEIDKLDAGSWFGEKFAGQGVPTLQEYLGRVEANGQNLLLELKQPQLYPGIEEQTLQELRSEGWLDRAHVGRRLVVQSFEADAVRNVHLLKPSVRTGFLGTPEVSELRSYAWFADQINPPYRNVTPEYVDAVQAVRGAHGLPLEVHAWTVDDAATARRVAEAGVDGIISNRPDAVRDAVG